MRTRVSEEWAACIREQITSEGATSVLCSVRWDGVPQLQAAPAPSTVLLEHPARESTIAGDGLLRSWK